jgi:hypothetical protein
VLLAAGSSVVQQQLAGRTRQHAVAAVTDTTAGGLAAEEQAMMQQQQQQQQQPFAAAGAPGMASGSRMGNSTALAAAAAPGGVQLEIDVAVADDAPFFGDLVMQFSAGSGSAGSSGLTPLIWIQPVNMPGQRAMLSLEASSGAAGGSSSLAATQVRAWQASGVRCVPVCVPHPPFAWLQHLTLCVGPCLPAPGAHHAVLQCAGGRQVHADSRTHASERARHH